MLVIATAFALWLKRRLYGKTEYHDAIVPLFLLTPLQYQAIFEGMSGGIFMVFLLISYSLAWTVSHRYLRWSLLLISNFLLIYADYGLFIGMITPLLLVYEYWRGRNLAVFVVLIISLLSFASFLIGYHFNPAADCFSPKPENPFYYALFVEFMLSSFVGVQPVSHLALALGVGFVLLLLFGWAFVKVTLEPGKNRCNGGFVTFALLSYSILFFVGTAYGRTCLGLGAAQASRYTGYSAVGFFALYLSANSLQSRRLLTAALVSAIMSTFGLSQWDKTQIARTSEGRQKWRDCYLAQHDINLCDQQSNSTIYWMPEPPDLQWKLTFLEKRGLNLFSENRK